MKRFFIAVLLIFSMILSPSAVAAEEMSDSYIAFEEIILGWSGQGLDMYPDYVGGVYFADNGNLVVSLSEDTEAHRNEVLALTSVPGCVEFASVSYSYSELDNLLIDINDSIDTDGYDFRAENAAIIEEKNYIEVYVSDDYYSAASDYFASAYGDKVHVTGDEEIIDDSEYYDDDYDYSEYDDSDYDYDDNSDDAEYFNEDAFVAFSELTAAWAEAGYMMYPAYVGGVYYSDNGNLVIALCEDTEANRNAILSLVSCSPEYLEFTSVSYSYDELYAIQDEIAENYNNGLYDFHVNFYSIDEEQNVVEIRVASSELDSASQYFRSNYGDRVVVLGGYETEEDTDLEELLNEGSDSGEKIKATSKLRMYISIGILAALIVAVVLISLTSANKASSAGRRYRK